MSSFETAAEGLDECESKLSNADLQIYYGFLRMAEGNKVKARRSFNAYKKRSAVNSYHVSLPKVASIIDAVKTGFEDAQVFEPKQKTGDSTMAMPGSDEKLFVLAERVRLGLPLWHPEDRLTYED